MNRVDQVAWVDVGRTGLPSSRHVHRVPIELMLLGIALGGALLTATQPLLGPAVAIALATSLMLRHLAAEVRALDAWDGK